MTEIQTVHYRARAFAAHIDRAYEVISAAGVERPRWFLQRLYEASEAIFAAYEDERIIGHVEVTANPYASHRCTISAAVEKPYWGQGIGADLMRTALASCDEQYDYVDGWAWVHNERALRMDRKLGFEPVATVRDAYRPSEGVSYDQVILVRKRGG